MLFSEHQNSDLLLNYLILKALFVQIQSFIWIELLY